MFWNNLRIRAKIGLGFFLLSVVVYIIGAIFIYNLYKIETEVSNLSGRYIPIINESNKLSRNWQEHNGYVRSFDFTGDPYFNYRADESFERVNNAFVKILNILKDDDMEIRRRGIRVDVMGEIINKYDSLRKKYNKSQLRQDELRKIVDKSVSELNELAIENNSFSGYKSLSRFNWLYNKVLNDVYNRNIYLLPSLKDELVELQRSMYLRGKLHEAFKKAVSDLNNYIDAEVEARKNEILRLKWQLNLKWKVKTINDIGADHVMEMADATVKTIRMQRSVLIYFGIFLLIFSTAMVWLIAREISSPIERGIKLALKVADGDLSTKYEVKGKDEVAQLLDALNRMIDNLRNIVNDISRSAEEISESSEKLNKEALELSEGATQQA
ncbi:MAG: methyl-accepting chemotaxis protein, partial [Chlorobi bacterium]|nr:methyl-accepting chemotaxis protein [Chlorobiota bacterium]